MSNWKAIRDQAHATKGWGIWLVDKDLEPITALDGALSIEINEGVNETTTAKIELRSDHPAIDAILPLSSTDPSASWRSLVDEAQWIIFEKAGQNNRLLYRVHRITDHQSRETLSMVTIEAKSSYRYVEKIACRSSPNAPLIAQLAYYDMRAGDALRTLKEYLLVNLMREFQPGAIRGWDLWTTSAWRSVSPGSWPAIVNPVHQSHTTVNTVLDARFNMAADFFKETLDAAALMMTVDVWLEGDPQPAPNHVRITQPTLIIDIVPRQFDTSTTGTALDFFKGLIRQFNQENNSPFLGLSDQPATAAGVLPWVVWRPEHIAGITSDFTVVKSEDWHVTVGGRSPGILNTMIGAGSKALFQGLGAALGALFPPFAGLAVAAGTFLGEITAASLKDKLFAWQQFSNAVRKQYHGRFAYRDQVGAGDGWTLSALQQGFQMLQAGAGMMSIGFESAESGPFRWGEHFRAGDQQGVEHRGIIFATYVSAVELTWTPTTGWREDITMGDQRARESFHRAYSRSIKSIANAVERFKTFTP
ncbi:hypothetical protein M3B03_04840 [Corynebacterium pseudodiphtheriticum]|uniref:Gp37-like protein n=1 Tax=Corynebacterium pseudodiphtheriticum TaxID=37637 RepID=UPI00223C3A5D|nr:hypothetical protein [Corynebacterium pseudodiphtheriticum]MCT1635029.1 hypothetical protein [Corynebacterium pseudodiphtheriticum]MCT1666122.1 hypothetical protein [Corynebacterium pseudodiphtheriticum]